MINFGQIGTLAIRRCFLSWGEHCSFLQQSLPRWKWRPRIARISGVQEKLDIGIFFFSIKIFFLMLANNPILLKSQMKPVIRVLDFFIRLYYFRAMFGSQRYWGEGTEMSHLHPAPTPTHSFLIINTPHHSGMSVLSIEHTLIHRDHPKSQLYIRVHSWCCTLYGF